MAALPDATGRQSLEDSTLMTTVRAACLSCQGQACFPHAGAFWLAADCTLCAGGDWATKLPRREAPQQGAAAGADLIGLLLGRPSVHTVPCIAAGKAGCAASTRQALLHAKDMTASVSAK